MVKIRNCILVLWFFIAAGCTPENLVNTISPGTTQIVIAPSFTLQANTPFPPSTFSPSPSASSTTKSTSTPLPSGTFTHTPSQTDKASSTPVYEILRGEVNVEHVMCFYGPSKAYLYKYGLLGGSNLEILGIMKDTGYIQIRAIGGDNPCWMNLEWMNVKGDISSLQPLDPLSVNLPWSPYYGPLSSVSATRTGSQVTITWSPLLLRAGDDSEQEPYLLEIWACQSGVLRFIPLGVYETSLTVEDQPGCTEASHGRVYGVEKHGYTKPLEIAWPQ